MEVLRSRAVQDRVLAAEYEAAAIRPHPPLAEVQHYAADLRSMSEGRGSYSMRFTHYDEVPAHIAQRIIQQGRKEGQRA